VTRALAAAFDRATGVDVAAPMIALAGRHNTAPDRCRFVTNRSAHLGRFASDSFDLVYSRMVLQHMPPRLVRAYIPELFRVLAPGGALVFQLPERIGVDAQEIFQNAGRRRFQTPIAAALVRAWRALKCA
jgi:SAM-dependent methyltransferase